MNFSRNIEYERTRVLLKLLNTANTNEHENTRIFIPGCTQYETLQHPKKLLHIGHIVAQRGHCHRKRRFKKNQRQISLFSDYFSRLENEKYCERGILWDRRMHQNLSQTSDHRFELILTENILMNRNNFFANALKCKFPAYAFM